MLNPAPRIQMQECVFLTNSQVMIMVLVQTTLDSVLSEKTLQKIFLWSQYYTTKSVASYQLVYFDLCRH